MQTATELTAFRPYPPFPVPPNERERLAALRSYEILDTLPEPSFDRIAATAARVFHVPIALVSLVDRDRQWFKARCGMDASETPRDVSFCAHAMLEDAPMVVCDATRDPRFVENGLVTGDLGVRFYAGAPLRSPSGLPLGALCVIDRQAREMPDADLLATLSDLAHLVVEQLEFRAAVTARLRADRARLRAEERYRLFAESAREIFLIADAGGAIQMANAAAGRSLGWPSEALAGQEIGHILPGCPLQTGEWEGVSRHRSGSETPVEISMSEFHSEGRKWAIVVRDISARKSSEAALRSAIEGLQAALGAKQVLLQEVHHRVKNNLQVILSLLQLQGSTAGDPALAGMLRESEQRVHAMALIHEKLCAGDEMAAIDFAEYARTLARELFQGYARGGGSVSGRVETATILLPVQQAIPCGLILNELVTNALKYAYPDGTGEVSIVLSAPEPGLGPRRVRLSVSDRGVGLPEGLDWSNAGSLGSRIVAALVKQLRGTLEISRLTPGVRFTVEFPRTE